MNEQDKAIKEKVLQSLLDFLDQAEAGRMKPKKAVSVEIAAPDTEHLAEGLDHAKDILGKGEETQPDPDAAEDSDEDRMRALLADSGDDEEEKDPSPFRRR